MKDVITRFAREYARQVDGQLSMEDEQRSIDQPVMFLVLGDGCQAVQQSLRSHNEMEWNNSEAIPLIYLSTQDVEKGGTLYPFQLADTGTDRLQKRPQIHARFYQDREGLIRLNRLIRQASGHLAQRGHSFGSLQTLNLAVITRADDPYNVLLPEVTLLVKSILLDSFKSVQVDLYLLCGGEHAELEAGYAQAVQVSFLEELDAYQQADYQFAEKLLLTADGIALPVEHQPGPLFSLTYLFDDRDERGVLCPDVAEQAQRQSKLISKLVLLKNQTSYQTVEQVDRFNRLQFWRSITAHSNKPAYASAGLARLNRPSEAIALTVLDALYRRVLARLEEVQSPQEEWLRQTLGLDEEAFYQRVHAAIPDRSDLSGLFSLMSRECSYRALTGLTVQAAEQELFGASAEQFFTQHFVSRRDGASVQDEMFQLLRTRLQQHVVADVRYGIFAAYEWTKENGAAKSLSAGLRRSIRDVSSRLTHAKEELADCYQRLVEELPLPKTGWFTREKERVQQLIRVLLTEIYERKYEILEWELLLAYLEASERALKALHESYAAQVAELYDWRKWIGELVQEGVRQTVADIGRNIREYYGEIVESLLDQQEAAYGSRYYLEHRLLGMPVFAGHHGTDAEDWLQRLIHVCRTELLNRAPFLQSFEEELLARSNVTTAFDNLQVLTREGLYDELYRRMQDQAAIRIELLHFSQDMRYEEVYYFGDAKSSWIQYAMERDLAQHTFKLGLIPVKRSGGIEKLQNCYTA